MISTTPSKLSTPARLTAPATAKLPRWALFALCAVYILAGLIGREPWKSDDVIGLAQMWTAAYSDNAWMHPQVAGIAVSQKGPLATWVGGGLMVALAPILDPIMAGRVANILWFTITASSLWYGVYLLGRRAEAQPLALPFGGQPSASAYGRMLADAALLLLLATLGFLWRSHETSAEPAAVAAQALAFYALARMADRPRSGAITLGVALAAAFLARGLPAVAPLLIALPVLFRPGTTLVREIRWLFLLALPIGLALSLAWWIPASSTNPYWMNGWWHWHGNVLGWISQQGAISTLRNLPWFLWPTLPLAGLAAWRWRGHRAMLHVQLPLALGAAAFVMLFFTERPSDPELLALVIPCAALGVFVLPTLRRGLVNALDWFALMSYSFALFVIWLGWTALSTGVPPKLARNIARQTPGFIAEFSVLSIGIAVAATIAWITLVTWRVRTRPAAMWRGSVLSAGGMVVSWLLLMTLWLPSINYSKSYRVVSQGLAQALEAEHRVVGKTACVRTIGLGLPQRASFALFDKLIFTPSPACPLVLIQGTPEQLAIYQRRPDLEGATVRWDGGRASDLRERFRLVRVPEATAQ
ncbi:MAG: glycosyltransferase [Burkholderiaceae bacterium]